MRGTRFVLVLENIAYRAATRHYFGQFFHLFLCATPPHVRRHRTGVHGDWILIGPLHPFAVANAGGGVSFPPIIAPYPKDRAELVCITTASPPHHSDILCT